jgi:hypothetical protein
MNEADNLSTLKGKNPIFSAREFPFGWWAFCFLLMVSSVEPRFFILANWQESKNFKKVRAIISSSMTKGESLPSSMAQLNLLGKTMDLNLEKLDSRGRPYEFISFPPSTWYISGSIETAAGYSDDWQEQFQAVSPIKRGPLGPWPQTGLISELSLDGKFIAKLFLSDVEPFRKLIVVKNNSKKTPVWVDTINQVEGFRWIESGLVYTTSLTAKGRSGAHLFIPKEGVSYFLGKVTESETPSLNEGLDQTRDSSSFNLVIMEAKGNFVEFAVTPDKGIGISPEVLFSSRKAFEITWANGAPEIRDIPLFYSPAPLSETPETLSPISKKFMALPVAGPGQRVLEEWQEQASQFEDTPLFSDILWGLAALYRNASIDLKTLGKISESNTLASYGAEYALSLSRRKDSPTWMKNCALWFWGEHQRMNAPLKTQDINLEWLDH